MKKILFVLTSAALVFTACQKEEENVANNGEGMSLTATVEQQVEGTETKSSLDGTSVKWTAGDEIKLFDNAGKGAKLIASSNSASSDFTEPTSTEREDGFNESNLSCAIYPYSAAKSCDGTNITFTLPVTQTYAENSFGPGANVAVGTFSSKSVAFKNVCGVFKLSLCGNFKVSKIVLKTKGEEKLCGTFTVNAASVGDGTTYSSGAVDSLTLNCVTSEYTNGVQLKSTTATTFYFVVPVGAFASGFVADVYENGQEAATYKYTELSTTADNSITRSRVKAMPESTIVPPAYQKVEYLESIGAQYINSEISAANIYKIESVLVVTKLSSPQTFFGARNDYNGPSTVDFMEYKTQFLSRWGGDGINSTNLSVNIGTQYKVDIVKNGDDTALLQINDVGYNNYCGGRSLPEEDVFIFRRNSSEHKEYSYSRQYRFLIWTDVSTLACFFIPAVCKSGASYTDGNGAGKVTLGNDETKPGMYDLVTGKFFVNQDSGVDFSTGSAVTH